VAGVCVDSSFSQPTQSDQITGETLQPLRPYFCIETILARSCLDRGRRGSFIEAFRAPINKAGLTELWDECVAAMATNDATGTAVLSLSCLHDGSVLH
jgi:hypothetical protein